MVLAELAMFAGFIWWAFTSLTGPTRWLVAGGIPLALATFWGYFLSPKATRPLPTPATTAIRLALLLTGAAAWWWAGTPVVAIGAAASALVGTAIAARWPLEQPPSAAA